MINLFTMLWVPYVLLFIALVLLFIALLALFRKTIRVWRLSAELKSMRDEVGNEGSELQDTINHTIEQFDGTLYFYRPVIHDRAAMEALALQNMVQDLRIMSQLVGYGESVGWGRAFALLRHYRVRLIVGRVALSASASDKFIEGMDKLDANLKVFEMLNGFRHNNLRKHAPYELSDERFPELQATQSQVVSMQQNARDLMEMLEQDEWRAARQSRENT